MEVVGWKPKEKFEPIKITITLETLDEVIALKQLTGFAGTLCENILEKYYQNIRRKEIIEFSSKIWDIPTMKHFSLKLKGE